MMTSAADTPSSAWMPVGMPRPLSSTLTDPSGFSVMMIRSQWPASASSIALSLNLEHHVVEAGPVVGVADIHAGALAHRVEALEDLDAVGAIFILVGIGCHGSQIGWNVAKVSRIRAHAYAYAAREQAGSHPPRMADGFQHWKMR